MPLESLNSENINIHDITLEQEKKPMTEAQRIFEELQNSNFFKDGIWMNGVDANGIDSGFRDANSRSQLIGVLCQLQFNKKDGQTKYDSLKGHDGFYDWVDNRWKYNYLYHDFKESELELLDVLILTYIDEKKAEEKYDRLKKTPLYDEENDMWYQKQRSLTKSVESITYYSDQLLSILIDDRLTNDPDEAKKKFYRMDLNKNYKAVKIGNIGKHSCEDCKTQLLSILVEARFDRKMAQDHFEKIKESKYFYDKDKEMWQTGIPDPDSNFKDHYESADQLLGIMCEKLFEKPISNLNNNTPPLPEERKF